jgi:hypothetical protein
MRSLIHLLKFAVGLGLANLKSRTGSLRCFCAIRGVRARSVKSDATKVAPSLPLHGMRMVTFTLSTPLSAVAWTFATRNGLKSNRWCHGAQNLVFIKGLTKGVGRRFNLPIDLLFY